MALYLETVRSDGSIVFTELQAGHNTVDVSAGKQFRILDSQGQAQELASERRGDDLVATDASKTVKVQLCGFYRDDKDAQDQRECELVGADGTIIASTAQPELMMAAAKTEPSTKAADSADDNDDDEGFSTTGLLVGGAFAIGAAAAFGGDDDDAVVASDSDAEDDNTDGVVGDGDSQDNTDTGNTAGDGNDNAGAGAGDNAGAGDGDNTGSDDAAGGDNAGGDTGAGDGTGDQDTSSGEDDTTDTSNGNGDGTGSDSGDGDTGNGSSNAVPAAPVVIVEDGDTMVTADEISDGFVTVSGTAQPGSDVTADWNGELFSVGVDADGNYSMDIPASAITAGDVDLSVVASNANGTSEPTVLSLTVEGPGDIPLPPAIPMPDTVSTPDLLGDDDEMVVVHDDTDLSSLPGDVQTPECVDCAQPDLSGILDNTPPVSTL